jgi:5-(aminomethyl)-3-furanmethanol phosphate kinase
MNLSVLKVGGGLSHIPGALDQVCAALSDLCQAHQLLIVPGGGAFADTVRRFQRQSNLSADAAHWMAILAMDQYAHAIADRIDPADLIEEPGQVVECLSRGKLPVLAPYRWMRSADVLPHDWDVTSDSIAAFIAGALGAERLILIKPAAADGLLDPYFGTALPESLPYLCISWRDLGEVGGWISGQSAGVGPRQ